MSSKYNLGSLQLPERRYMEEMYYEIIQKEEFPMLFFEYNSGRILTMNPAAEAVLGKESEWLYTLFAKGAPAFFEENESAYQSQIFYECWVCCGMKEQPLDIEISTFLQGNRLIALMCFDYSSRQSFTGYRKKLVPRVYAKDACMRVQMASRGVFDDIGVSGGIQGKVNEDFLPESAAKAIFDGENMVYLEQKMQLQVVEFICVGNKKTRFIQSSRIPRITEDGEFEGILGIYTPVLSRDECMELLKSMKRENDLYGRMQLFNGSFPIQLSWNGEQFQTEFISHWVQEYGYGPEEFYDGTYSFTDLMDEEGKKAFYRRFEERTREKAQGEKPLVYQMPVKDGGYVPILDEASWVLRNGCWYYEGLLTDLNLQETIRGQEQQLGIKREMAASQESGSAKEGVLQMRSLGHEITREASSMADFLQKAIDMGCMEFSVYYQPIVDSVTREMVGAEALLRWHSPELGFINPVDFIPLSEYLGLILPLGEYVIESVFRLAEEYKELPLNFHINLSVVQLIQPKIVEYICDMAEKWRVDPKKIIFEVTESLAIEDMNLMKKVLQSLRNCGFRIALDDFGSGYSSLNHVMEMPLDYLKVDKEFIAGYGSKRFSPALLTAIAELSHSLSLKMIVEGVEKKSQVDFLNFLDVDQYQGFYFGKPVSEDIFRNLLKNMDGSKVERI